MMEVNEVLMEMEFEMDTMKLMDLRRQVDQMEMSLFDELKQNTDKFDLIGKNAESILLKIKDIWYRQKYLMRIRESLNKFQV